MFAHDDPLADGQRRVLAATAHLGATMQLTHPDDADGLSAEQALRRIGSQPSVTTREYGAERVPRPFRDIVILYRMLRRAGLRATIAHTVGVVLYRAHVLLIDRRHFRTLPATIAGATTVDGMQVSTGMAGEVAAAEPCGPVTTKTLDWAIAALRIDPSAYTFVDIGAGWGYALVRMARHPFRQLIGVEFARPLLQRAERNIAAGVADPQRVSLRYESALQIELPEGPVVLFLFHPFSDEVLRPFLDRVCQSARRSPGPILVVYANPVHHDVFDRPEIRERRLAGRAAWLIRLLSPFSVRAYEVSG